MICCDSHKPLHSCTEHPSGCCRQYTMGFNCRPAIERHTCSL